MRKIFTAVLLGLSIVASSTTSFAQDSQHAVDHARGGLGFRLTRAPIGIRWWLSDMVGIDAGVGFTSEKFADIGTDPLGNPEDVTFSAFSADIGVPLRLRTWDSVHFILRPGLIYTTEDDQFYFDITGTKEKRNTFAVSGEFEVEYFVAKNFSLSASHGVEYASTKLDVPNSKSDTAVGTFGSNFTTLGFHVYLWGPSSSGGGQ
jgi:hypothetical protein